MTKFAQAIEIIKLLLDSRCEGCKNPKKKDCMIGDKELFRDGPIPCRFKEARRFLDKNKKGG